MYLKEVMACTNPDELPLRPAGGCIGSQGGKSSGSAATDTILDAVTAATEVDGRLIGKRVIKYFDAKAFFGTITAMFEDKEENRGLWHVVYDDEDEEDLYLDEILAARELFRDYSPGFN